VSERRDRGSAVVADLAVGAAIVIVLASAATAAGLVIDTAQSSREAARSAAVELARGHGPASALRRAGRLAPPDAEITHQIIGAAVVVRAEARTLVPHPIAGRRHIEITVEVVVPIAPYRSR